MRGDRFKWKVLTEEIHCWEDMQAKSCTLEHLLVINSNSEMKADMSRLNFASGTGKRKISPEYHIKQ